MGLVIHAYSRLQLVEPHTYGDRCEDEDHIHAYAYAGFERSLRGVPGHDQPATLFGRPGWVGGRCYTRTGDTEDLRALEMPYGSYNRWRDSLSLAMCGMTMEDVYAHAEVLDPEAVPFYELIVFADNEGAIGPEAAADLLQDFTNAARARFEAATATSPPPWPGYYVEAWDLLRDGVALAADAGLLAFT